MGLDELIILTTLSRDGSLTAEDAGRLIQKPQPEALMVLARLTDAGLIEARGRKQGGCWCLSAAASRTLGDGMVRGDRSLRDVQELENSVVQFVEMHGRITRRQAAGLCHLGPHQATRLLDRLVTAGRLLRHGERKGSWYERGRKI